MSFRAMCRGGLTLLGLVLGFGPAAWGGGADPFDRDAALAYSQAAIGRTLGDYTLLDRNGQRLSLAELAGKPLVVSFVYTSCYHICPATTRHLASAVRLGRQALGEDGFRVVTIGFDTAFDKPEAMQAFAKKQGVALADWRFLSGDQPTIDALAQDLGFLYVRSPNGYDHLIQATIIDGEGKVYRQVYGELIHTPLLVEPLKELVFGVKPNEGFMQGLLNRVRLFCTVYDPAGDRYKFDYSLFIGIGVGATLLSLLIGYFIHELRRSRSSATSRTKSA